MATTVDITAGITATTDTMDPVTTTDTVEIITRPRPAEMGTEAGKDQARAPKMAASHAMEILRRTMEVREGAVSRERMPRAEGRLVT
jgi:hypothetical protein